MVRENERQRMKARKEREKEKGRKTGRKEKRRIFCLNARESSRLAFLLHFNEIRDQTSI